jgi:hypothetical protein
MDVFMISTALHVRIFLGNLKMELFITLSNVMYTLLIESRLVILLQWNDCTQVHETNYCVFGS